MNQNQRLFFLIFGVVVAKTVMTMEKKTCASVNTIYL